MLLSLRACLRLRLRARLLGDGDEHLVVPANGGEGRVVLRDGSARAIERIVVGEALAGGSVAVATLRFDAAAAAPLFEVRGVRVTADHAVLLDGRFVRARDAAGATRAPAAADGLVYDLITTDHRIRIVADGGAELECADYLELPEGRVAYDRLLGRLNAGLAAA